MLDRARLDALATSYLAGANPRDPAASPVFGDFSGVAPILVHVGAHEVLLGDALAVAQAAGAADVAVRLEIWPQMIHVWHGFADRLAEARRAVAASGAWMRERLSQA